jgi:hypothetical protein
MVNISKKKIWDERSIYENIRFGKGSGRGASSIKSKEGSLAYLNTLAHQVRRANGEARLLSGLSARSNLMQKSIVKGSFAQNHKGGQWRAHARYIERVVAQGHAMGFNAQKDDIGLANTLAAWQEAGDRHVYKFIVSPEQGARLDLKEHARTLVRAMEKDQGVKLEWCAIVHTNTDHPHVHICVRGRDTEGRTLVIEDEYIKRGIRQASREIATRELGFQRANDIIESRERSIKAMRVTELDRIIERYRKAPNMNFSTVLSVEQKSVELDQMNARLEFLASRGLAVLKEGGYEPVNDFIDRLKAHQKERDIAQSLASERKHMIDPDQKIVDRTLKTGEFVMGRVAGVIYDEAKDKRYLLLETEKGEAVRLRMSMKLEQERDGANLQRGDFIILKAKEIQIEGKTVKTHVFENHKDLLDRDTNKLSARDITRIDVLYHNQREVMLERTNTEHVNKFQKHFVDVMEKRNEGFRRDIQWAQARDMGFEQMQEHFARSRSRSHGHQLSL